MKAIPTRYKGVQFRSRLEARWAAMFDLLEWRWEYEPIDLEGYIPDFVLMFPAGRVLVEIKPAFTVAELLQQAAAKVDSTIQSRATFAPCVAPTTATITSAVRLISERCGPRLVTPSSGSRRSDSAGPPRRPIRTSRLAPAHRRTDGDDRHGLSSLQSPGLRSNRSIPPPSCRTPRQDEGHPLHRLRDS
jgi:hypothetical protein